MLRLLTVTLNPALDAVYETPNFTVGALNRPTSRSTSAGGKGINVARVYRALGGDATAMGLAGGRTGADIVAAAKAEGIPEAFVKTAAESRLCIKIADPVVGTQTELNEAGPVVTADEYAAFVTRFRELIPNFDVVVLAGSVPPGVPVTVYGELIKIAQDDYGVSAILDASGDALVAGITAQPTVVKPNLIEVGALGIQALDWREAARGIRARYAVETAIVTSGSEGAVIDTVAGAWIAQPPSITVKSTVGSGDSMTAGFIWAWGTTADFGEALRFGVAAGTVNAQSYRSGEITRDAVVAMSESVALTVVV